MTPRDFFRTPGRARRAIAARKPAAGPLPSDEALRALLEDADTDHAGTIDEARVRRLADTVVRRIADEARPGRSAIVPALAGYHGYHLAALMIAAALLGGVAGWYSSILFEGVPNGDLQALLAAPIDHPFGLFGL